MNGEYDGWFEVYTEGSERGISLDGIVGGEVECFHSSDGMKIWANRML